MAYLANAGGDLDEKDSIYRSLVAEIQGKDEFRAVAVPLAWLGLWPALDHIYRRHCRFFRGRICALVSGISEQFSKQLATSKLDRINRLAATLTRNVSRELVTELRRDWRRASTEREEVQESLSDHAPLQDHAHEMGEVRARLERAVGGDAELLFSVLVDGLSQREAADRLGLSHEATRKRYQRALDRARDAMSHSGSLPRVSLPNGARAPRNGRTR